MLQNAENKLLKKMTTQTIGFYFTSTLSLGIENNLRYITEIKSLSHQISPVVRFRSSKTRPIFLLEDLQPNIFYVFCSFCNGKPYRPVMGFLSYTAQLTQIRHRRISSQAEKSQQLQVTTTEPLCEPSFTSLAVTSRPKSSFSK